MIECRAPKNEQEFQQYYQLRWEILRKPWHQPLGSEQDRLEALAIHRMIINEHGEVCAVGRLHFSGTLEAQIRYMAVDNEYQGKGFGAMLLTEFENIALSYGIKKIILNARQHAVDFYRRLGYQGEEVSHVLYDEIAHITMEKIISTAKNNALADKLVTTWHNTIPLSKAMGIYITNYSGEQLVCSCDIGANKNLHNTMFAGSIYTLATLTGWGAIYLKLAEQNLSGDIVLAHADIKYKAPIPDVAFARAQQLNHHISFSTLSTKGRAKVSLTVEVLNGEQAAALFEGTYVVKGS